MGQQVRQRRQGSINISAFNTKYTQTLSRGYWLREIHLKYSGTMTWGAAANNAAASLGRADEWSSLARIELIANGTDVIRSFSGLGLKMLNRFLYGQTCRLSAQMGDGATASPAFASYLIIPIWQPMSVKPMDTALDTRKLSDLRLEITVGPSSDVQSAAAATAINAILDINLVESFGVEGDVSDCKIYTLQSALQATGSNQQITLPVTCLYRGVLVNFAQGGGVNIADQPADKITRIAFKSGTTVFREYAFDTVREWQRMRANQTRQLIQTVAAGAGVSGGYVNTSRSLLANEDAWAWLDFVQDGYLGEGIDALGLSEFYMEVDTNGATNPVATLFPVQIFPRRSAA